MSAGTMSRMVPVELRSYDDCPVRIDIIHMGENSVGKHV